jgi:hypothetical protein
MEVIPLINEVGNVMKPEFIEKGKRNSRLVLVSNISSRYVLRISGNTGAMMFK